MKRKIKMLNTIPMQKEKLERLLNTACEIITELEHNADEEQIKRIDAMFNEILYSDEIDSEIMADEQAQDWVTFNHYKTYIKWTTT
jgi:hypothetical protein